MESSSYPLVMNHLYQLMKKQKMSYSRLGKVIEIPESTVKKWFSAEDGSLGRINLICEALETTLRDVLKAVSEERVHTFVMGKKQQEYFLNDMTAFEVYWLSVYERLSPLQIQQALRISEAELRKYFLKLDRLSLVEVNVKEKVLIPKINPIRWSPEGPFMQKIFKSWSVDIINSGLQSSRQSDLILQYFQLSPQSEIELRKDLVALEEKYARRTIQEMRSHEGAPRKIRFIGAMAEGDFLKIKRA